MVKPTISMRTRVTFLSDFLRLDMGPPLSFAPEFTHSDAGVETRVARPLHDFRWRWHTAPLFFGERNPLTESYQLFQYDQCPFCRRVRQFMDAAGIDIEIRDTLRDPEALRELIRGGGRSMVPCLKIQSEEGTRWLYESADIITYLRDRFAAG
jgi:glutaredoxin